MSKASNPASGTSVTAGQTITYTLTAVVSQAALTQPLVLTDTLSAGQTFGSVTVPGAYTANVGGAPTLVFTLPAGTVPGSYSVSYTATVDNNASGSVGNIVVATGGGPTPPSCNTCSTTHPLVDPTVTYAKSSDPASGTAVSAGDTISYTLTATVANSALLSDLVLTDVLSGDQAFAAVINPGSFTADTSGAPTLQFTLPAGTAPGSYPVTYTATVNSDATGSVGNAVTGTGGTPPGGNPPGCATPGGCETTHPLTDPTVTYAKSSDPASGTAVSAGDTISYTLTATVANSALLSDLVLTDVLSGDQAFAAVINPGSFTADTSGAPTLQFTLPAGTAPGSYPVTYTATVNSDATGSVGNAVTGTGGTPPGGNPPGCATPGGCETTHPLSGNLGIVKVLAAEDGMVAGVAEPGETLTYQITLSNSGGVAETGVAITDQLDPNTSFVSADHGGTHSLGVVTWTGLTVPAGGSLVLVVEVQVDDPIAPGVTRIANLVYETGMTPPACPPSGPQCVVTPTAPDVTVTKAVSAESIDADGVAQPGEEITYTITLRNEGGTPALNTIVNEWVPNHTRFVGGVPTWSCAPGSPAGTACDNLVDVPAHDGSQPGLVSLTFIVRVDDPLAAGVSEIANGVAVNDGPPPDCASTPTLPACAVMPAVNLRFTKTVAAVTTTGPSTFRVDYDIEIVNLGGGAASYTATDTPNFAPGVVFTGNAQVSSVGGTVNPALPGGQFLPANGSTVQISAANLSIAAGATHHYTVSVPIGVQPGSLGDAVCDGTPGHGLYNAAALSGSYVLDSAACAPVDGDVALIKLVKSVTLDQDFNGNQYGDVGDVLAYSFAISNVGTVPLSTVQLFDPRVQGLSCAPFTDGGLPFKVLGGDELFDSGFEFRAGGGSLQPGDSVQCFAGYVLTATDVANRRVVNSATATGTGPAGQTVSSVATAIFTAFR